MPLLNTPMTDERMDRIIGNLLRAGVVLAAAVVLAGEIWPHIAALFFMSAVLVFLASKSVKKVAA